MQFKRKQRKTLSIEITPLIDVIFLLLIFFMVSTTFVSNPGIKVKLPEASQRPTDKEPKSLEVVVTQKNEIFLEGKPVRLSALRNKMKEMASKKKSETLIIKADGKVRHETVVTVMDYAKLAGIQKLSIGTSYRKP